MFDVPATVLHALVGAGATLTLEYTGRSAIASLGTRALRTVWSFLSEDTHVFVSLLRPLKEGAAIGFGDLLSISTIAEIKNRHFSRGGGLHVHTVASEFEKVKAENLVILGGGRHNSIYRDLVESLRVPLHFFDTATQSFSEIRNTDRSIVYTPTYDDAHVVQKDTGILVRARNPLQSEKTVVIAAGSHSFGTGAAISYMASREGISDLRKHASSNCEAVVQCHVVNGTIVDVTRISQVLKW